MMKKILQLFSVKKSGNENRIEQLDYIRGLAIILVLLHHSMMPGGDWILAFHMPLLFLLSGYTESLRNRTRTFLPYFKNRLLRLVVPYFLFEFVNLAAWYVSLKWNGGHLELKDAVYAIAACLNTDAYTGFYGRLWFLPCMFVSDLWFFAIRRICGKRKTALWFSAAGMLVLSWCTCQLMPFRLPFAMDTAFLATAFLIMGYVSENEINRLLQEKKPLTDGLTAVLSLLVLWFSVKYGRGYCLMFMNNYGPFGWTILAAVSGSVLFFVMAKWMYALNCRVPFGRNLVLWYGYHSLAVFPVHLSIKIAFLRMVRGPFRTWQLLMLVMLLLSVPVVNAIERYLPFMLGNYRRNPDV